MATSFTERHMAATSRLKLIMESAVSIEMIRMNPRVPGNLLRKFKDQQAEPPLHRLF